MYIYIYMYHGVVLHLLVDTWSPTSTYGRMPYQSTHGSTPRSTYVYTMSGAGWTYKNAYPLDYILQLKQCESVFLQRILHTHGPGGSKTN